MKTIMKFWLVGWMILHAGTQLSIAQKIDEDRMKRDLEVAENILSTLIKQEFGEQRGFFGLSIKANYLPGYGVTFRLPGGHNGLYMLPVEGNTVIYNSDRAARGTTVITTNGDEENDEDDPRLREYKLRERKEKKLNSDSISTAYNQKMIKAAKDFILDYGDFISQLQPNEKIVITNQNQGGENFVWISKNQKRTHLSIEAVKSDIVAFKQNKLTREQAMAKITVLNTESLDIKEPDMELLASIFSRLYRTDLSRTYFTEGNVYYERLKDYGAIFYMQVFSGYNSDYKTFSMPTVDLKDVDQATRDKKVVELYPKFEQDVKENILEYGRTLKSLKDEETLVFKITLTKCKGCNIPENIELSVKNSVLKEYGAGRMDKNTAFGKFVIKKGPNQ
jgi:hypothetical protein